MTLNSTLNSIIIYLKNECIEKYQFELCSKYDREYGFDVIHNKEDHLEDYLDFTFIVDSGCKLSTRLMINVTILTSTLSIFHSFPGTYHLANIQSTYHHIIWCIHFPWPAHKICKILLAP